jgi:hypothetical protein
VWFAYSPSSEQSIALDALNSSYPVAGAVLTGTPASFSAVSCFLGSTNLRLKAGTTYYIELVDYSASGGGTLNLSLTQQLPPNPTVTIDPTGIAYSKSGAAKVSGTASCNAGSWVVFMNVTLTQEIGSTKIVGSSPSPAVVCDGTPQPWSAVVRAFSEQFSPGRARVSVGLAACNLGCQFADLKRTVQLKRPGALARTARRASRRHRAARSTWQAA